MKKRPLCSMCLIILLVEGIFLIMMGGQSFKEVSASSIFYEEGGGNEILIQGQVYKKSSTSKIQVLYLKNNSIDYQNQSYHESKILIYDNTFEEVPIGTTVCVKGSAEKFEEARNPGNFDQQLYYAKQGIYGYVWSEEILTVKGEVNTIQEALCQFRQRWKAVLIENTGEENGGALSAMLLGDKSAMDDEIKELYQKNGIGHILAISGLHISFIGLGIYHLLRKTGTSYLVSGAFSLLILSAYVLMIGFSVSVIRAYVMLLLRIGADIAGRVYDMLTAVMFAATIIVVYQPLYLTDAGFYMSHGAILSILLLVPEIKKLLPCRFAVFEKIYSSLGINLALFPVMLWFYFEVPTYSLLLNMAVIPLMSWVLGLGIFGSIGYFIWKPLGKVLLKACSLILTFFEKLAELGCQIPFSRVVFGKPNWWEIMMYYVILLGIVLFLRNCKKEEFLKKSRKFILLAMSAVVLSFVKLPNGRLQVTMIDVGQGDSIFAKGPYGNTYLIDGGSSDVDSVGKYRIEPFLKSQGVGTLDYVFVSHGDSDHYSGILEMIERQKFGVKIKNLVLPANYQTDEEMIRLIKTAAENQISVSIIDGGQTISEGKLQIKCLQPGSSGPDLEGNAGSMVLEICFDRFDMLCVGDVEKEGEEMLTQKLGEKTYDVLKVAHHGSKNSSAEEFLKTVQPGIALISAGENNQYGHPHEVTIQRLLEVGSKIYQTAKEGAIQFETDGDVIDIFPSSI